MHLLPRAFVLCAFLLVSHTATAAPPSTTPPPRDPSTFESPSMAESVRVQPRGNGFASNSAEEAAVQERLRIFNTRQDLLDAEFDRKLRICRGC
jgi:hypothetical protein